MDHVTWYLWNYKAMVDEQVYNFIKFQSNKINSLSSKEFEIFEI